MSEPVQSRALQKKECEEQNFSFHRLILYSRGIFNGRIRQGSLLGRAYNVMTGGTDPSGTYYFVGNSNHYIEYLCASDVPTQAQEDSFRQFLEGKKEPEGDPCFYSQPFFEQWCGPDPKQRCRTGLWVHSPKFGFYNFACKYNGHLFYPEPIGSLLETERLDLFSQQHDFCSYEFVPIRSIHICENKVWTHYAHSKMEVLKIKGLSYE